MKFFWRWILLTPMLEIFLQNALAKSNSTINRRQGRIVNGVPTPNSYPYQIQLYRDGLFICSGAIVSKRWVLTAAHCVYNTPSESLTVNVGAHQLYDFSYRIPYQVRLYKYYKDYDPATHQHDIALIQLYSEIEFSERVHQIEVAITYLDQGTPVTLAGWGNTASGTASPILLYQNFKTYPLELCKKHFPFINEFQICTEPNPRAAACHGDSGGPLTVLDGQFLVGVVSYGDGICRSENPDIYTSALSYIDWILRVITQVH